MAIIPRSNVGPQDKLGEMLRRIDRALTGGPNGPVRVTASFVAPAYGANAADPDCDAFYACDATGGAIVITAPVAANTPLGTTIAVSKVDAGGNTVTFSAADAAIDNGGTTKTTAAGITNRYTLANLNSVLTWIAQ